MSNKAVKEAKEITNMMKKNRNDRKKTKDFLTNEKNITINKDNQILLNKLVEISSGKWSSVAPVPVKKNRNQSVKVKGPTSLNMGVRKRETERIERENHAFAKRLFDKQAVLQKKSLDNDYMQHMKYKKQIAKMQTGKSMQQSVFSSKKFQENGMNIMRPSNSMGGQGMTQEQQEMFAAAEAQNMAARQEEGEIQAEAHQIEETKEQPPIAEPAQAAEPTPVAAAPEQPQPEAVQEPEKAEGEGAK